MKLIVMTLILAFLLIGCGDKKTENQELNAGAAKESKVFKGLFVKKLDGAIRITDARKLKPGDKVTVTGRVMGADEVFVEGRAFMLIGDPGVLTSCDKNEGDSCATPWDNCCDSVKDKKAGTLSVQVVDKDGKILKSGLRGKGGLMELVTVTVKGSVTADSNADMMTINAESIVVE